MHAGPGAHAPWSRFRRACDRALQRWWLPSVERLGLPAAAGLGLLGVSAAIITLTSPLQASMHDSWEATAVVLASLVGALVLGAVLPWRRWPVRAALAFPATAVLAVAALSVAGDGTGAVYVGLFMLAFMHVGLFLPARSCWWLVPWAATLYGPASGGWSATIVVRLMVVVLVWVLMAEVLCRLSAHQRHALTMLDALASTDPLTQVGNRRALRQHFDVLADGDVVVVCDLDHFKAVNDAHGHDHGDELLVGFAAMMRTTLREGDVVARLGGEEFVLVLRGIGADDVSGLLGRLHRRWAVLRPGTTFSTGWAVHRRACAASQTLAAADRALYASKEAGRDRDTAEQPDLPAEQQPERPAEQRAERV